MDTSGAPYPDRGQPGQRTGGTGQQPPQGDGRGGIPQGMGQIMASLIAMTGDLDLAENAPKTRSPAPCSAGPRRRADPAPGPGSPRQPATGLSTCCQPPRDAQPRPAANSRPRNYQCHSNPVTEPPNQQHVRPPVAAQQGRDRTCAGDRPDHPDMQRCTGPPHSSPANAYRRISRAVRPRAVTVCHETRRLGRQVRCPTDDTASSGFRARHPHLDPMPLPKFEHHDAPPRTHVDRDR